MNDRENKQPEYDEIKAEYENLEYEENLKKERARWLNTYKGFNTALRSFYGY